MRAIFTYLLFFLLISFPTIAPAQNVNTIIGGLGDNGMATVAELYLPKSVAVDKSGNTYVADAGNGVVRKVDNTGKITLFAGTPGSSPYMSSGDGGLAILGRIGSPAGLAVDSSGNVFIADDQNNKIRKVDVNGILSTYAGAAGFGGDGGPASAASLNNPTAIAIDKSGNMYIAQTAINKIRKINTSGIISTIAGTGTAGALGDGSPATIAQLYHPTGVCVDKYGNVFIADNENNKVRKIDPTGIISTFAGNGIIGYSGDGFPATSANFNKVTSVAADTFGNIYITDNSNNEIRKVNTSGIITTVAGTFISGGFSGDGGAATSAKLSLPGGVALDQGGNMYICDVNNNRVRKVNVSGTISTIAGCSYSSDQGYKGNGGPAVSALLNNPRGLAFDTSGNLYIADENNHVVRKVSPAGIISTFAGNDTAGFSGDGGPATNARLNNIGSLAADRKGNIYICDDAANRIRKVNSASIISTYAGNGTGGFSGDGHRADSAKIDPVAIATDKFNNLFISDYSNNRIRKVDTNGIITTIAGTGSGAYFGDGGPATAAQIYHPGGICTDTAGNIFFADRGNNRVRTINSAGIISTVAGGGTGGLGGLAIYAAITNPSGVTMDLTGNIFIADGNGHFYKVNTAGIISQYAGSTGPGVGFSGDGGPALNAVFSSPGTNPSGIVADKAGNLLIPDVSNNRIREIYNASIAVSTPSDTICAGLGAVFTATVTCASIYTLVYHWQKNGVNVGTNTPSYSAPLLSNLDKISCYITDGIAGARLAESNVITVIVPSGTPSLAISAGSTSVCAIATVTCNAYPANGGSHPTFNWYRNGTIVFTGNPYIFTPVNGDSVRCKITSSLACMIPDTAISNRISFTTYAPHVPVVTITVTPGLGVCQGTAVTCTAHHVYGGLPPIYTWYKNGVFVSTGTAPNYTFVPANLDVIGCKMLSSEYCVSPDTAFTSVIFTVDTPAYPAVTISADPGDTICPGDAVTFAATASLGGSAPIYRWYKNGTLDYTGSSYAAHPLNTDVFFCKMTSNSNCVLTDSAISNYISFTYRPLVAPSVNVSVSPGDTICPGDAVMVTATSIEGGASPVYQWFKNGNLDYTWNSYIIHPLNTDVFYCKLISSSNCAVPDTAVSSNILFVYGAVVIPSVSVSVNPGDHICSGTSVALDATPVNGGTLPQYQWFVNGLLRGLNPTFQFSPHNADEVYCELTSNAYCRSDDHAASSSTQFTVTPSVVPSVNISVDPDTLLCSDLPVRCIPVSTDEGAAPVYMWYVNGNYVYTGAEYDFTPHAGDDIYCSLTSTAFCAVPPTINSKTSHFRIEPLPSVTISCSPDQLNFRGTMVNFSASLSSYKRNYSYQWVKNGVPIPGAHSAAYSSSDFSVWDSVKCVVTDSGACEGKATSNTLVIDTYHGMKLYPDPNNGNFIINGNNYDANSDPVNIRIYTAAGKLVYEADKNFDNVTFYTEINLQDVLPSGVYYLKLSYKFERLTFVFAVKH